MRRRSVKARNALVEANKGFAWMLAKRYGPSRGLSEDDAVQAALLGMTRAAELYDPSVRCKFISYAKFRILREINIAGLRNRGGCAAGPRLLTSGRMADADPMTRAALAEPASYDNGAGALVFSLRDPAAVSPEQYAMDQEQRSLLRELIATLPPKWGAVIAMRYMSPNGLTLMEIGRKMGFSRQRAEQIEIKSLASMRLTYLAWQRGRS